MFKWICGLLLLNLGSGIVAVSGVSLIAPLFDMVVGPARSALLMGAIGVLTIAAGWGLLLARRPRRIVPTLLVVTWWGAGLALGTIRGNDLGALSLRNWSAVLMGAGVAGCGLWFLRRTGRAGPPETA